MVSQQNKEAYYFSHDTNARNDEKLITLRMKHGWAGYGLFWAIIEKMREATNYMCTKDYNMIAFDLRADAALIKSIIEDFGLFVFTECSKYFYSVRLHNSMEIKEYKSQKASENAKKRWGNDTDNQQLNAMAMRTHSDGNAKLKICNAIKEKKVKESKVKERVNTTPERLLVETDLSEAEAPPVAPPPHTLQNSNLFRQPVVPKLEKVKEVFRANGGTEEMAEKFFNKHDAVGWFYNNSPITRFENFVTGFITTFRDIEKRQNARTTQTSHAGYSNKNGGLAVVAAKLQGTIEQANAGGSEDFRY